jgi:(p)ppGpp synthase/HD superfamily hydrolase
MQDAAPMFLDDIETELQRRLDGLIAPDATALPMWVTAVETITDRSTRQRNFDAYEFARSIDYRHGSMTSEIYFCHPLRVAAMSIFVSDSAEPDIGILGLLHNVLEVSAISHFELCQKFGKSVADQIVALTVERKLEWADTYKATYYQKIIEGPRAARIVKILDKLDNIFLINQNTDSQVRFRYLKEIEEKVLPMARCELPGVARYMDRLLADSCSRDPIANR